MIDLNQKGISYPTQFGILLGLTGAGLLISMLASYGIWMVMEHSAFPTNEAELLQPKYYTVNMVLQGVSTFCIFFLPAMAYAWICYRRPAKFIGFSNRFNFGQVVLVCAILMVALPLAGAIGELNRIIPLPASWEMKFKAMETARKAQEASFIKIDSPSKYVLSLFMIGLLPALFEETFFRGGLQNLFARWFRGPWLAIIVTSIIFSIIHISYYGFLVRFSLGVILGLLFHYSKNLWLPVIFHLLFNGIQVTALYVMTRMGMNKPNDIEEQFPVWLGILSLVFIIYLFMMYKKRSEAVLEKYSTNLAGTLDIDDAQPKNF